MDAVTSYKGLRLMRAAIVGVGRPPVELESFHLGRGDAFVEVGRAVQVDGDPVGHIVVAVVPGVTVKLDHDKVDVPADARRDTETMIETLHAFSRFAIGRATRSRRPCRSSGWPPTTQMISPA